MTKSDLVRAIALRYPNLLLADAERAVNIVFDEMTSALAKGHRVELRGFGAFSVKKRDARQGRNPRTGENVSVQAKATPFFKCGKGLRDRLNGWESDGKDD